MFDLFRKLFKAFNSAQTPWQMSLALSLGMAMGLTPFGGLQTVALIFIVFIINVHLGLFFVSAGFFAGLAYLLDPVFEQIGFAILTNESLKEIFTTAYNSGLMRLTNFNNTLVIGSSVVAFSLFIPMYFILNKIVYIYRDKIAAKLSQYKFFKILGVEVTDKKDKFLRLWGAGVFVVLGGIIGLFVFMFMDTLAKSAIEASLSKVTGKTATVNSVEISFEESSFNINGLNIYDETKSLIKSDNIGVNIDFNQLLFKHYHIANINISGLSFDESAPENNAQDSSASKSPSKSSKSTKESASKDSSTDDDSSMLDGISSSLPSPQTLVGRSGLSSQKNIEEAKAKLDGIDKKYTDALDKDFSKEEVDSIKNELKALEKKLKAKDYSTIKEDLKNIKKLQKKLKEKKNLADKLKKDFKKDKLMVNEFSKVIKNGALSDYSDLSKNYKFDSKGGVNVIGVLFGDKTKAHAGTFLKYYEMAKPYLGSDEKEEVAPQRGDGRWIKYKEFNNQVEMWVKNVEINGIYDSQTFRANITNISSNQKLIGKPMKLILKSEAKLADAVDIGLGSLDSASYKFDADAKTFDYKTLDAKANINYTNTKFSSKYMKKINSFYVDIKATKEIISPKLKVSTNLDNKLKDVFKKVLKEKADKYKKELKSLIDKNTKDSIEKLTKNNETLSKIEDKLGLNLKDLSSTQTGLKSLEKDMKKSISDKFLSKKKKAETKKKAKKELDKLKKKFKF